MNGLFFSLNYRCLRQKFIGCLSLETKIVVLFVFRFLSAVLLRIIISQQHLEE